MYESYKPVIGLEVHCQLATEAKIFSPDATTFDADPNVQVDPITLGHPGTLPALNKEVLEQALRLGVATGCEIAARSVFARKHYFYPDLPKGYQITQYDRPLCYDGRMEIELDDSTGEALRRNGKPTRNGKPARSRQVGIRRIHIEEDAGRSVHHRSAGSTLVDYNRSGIPLVELVTEPDLRSPREAYLLMRKIRQTVRYLGISDGNMEEGSLRCDANVSVRRSGGAKAEAKTEVKNVNSFRGVERALEYEVARQIRVLETGGALTSQTRFWDADRRETRPLRTKEEERDYRYIPDPDLVPVPVSRRIVEQMRASLPEMPEARRARFIEELGLSDYDASVVTEERGVADYFEETLNALYKHTRGGNTQRQAKMTANFVTNQVLRVLNEQGLSIEDLPVGTDRAAHLIYLRLEDEIGSSAGQEIFEAMARGDEDGPEEIARNRGLIQVAAEDVVEPVVDEVLKRHSKNVHRYKSGKKSLIGFFIGEVMSSFDDGEPDPKLVRGMLKEKLES